VVSGLVLLVALIMAVGLVGVVLPGIPGLVLVWAGGLWWTIAQGGAGAWVVFGLLTVLFVVGTAAKYVLAGKAASTGGPATRTLLLGAFGGIVGFFLIPVVGLVLGGLAGIYLGERLRLGDGRAAWNSTLRVLTALGIGVLIELLAGLVMVVVWATGVLVT
jgi:uncharacterized protein YqgC (DUF456 family)